MKKNPPLIVAGILFSLVAVVHVLRLVFDVSVVIGGTMLPEWASWLGLIIPAILAIWMFKAARR